jgi:uncharacterized membrane protein YedE/YeeE
MKFSGLLFGMAFGFLIAAAGFGDYDTIHNMLLLREAHAYLVMGSAVGVAMLLLWLMERRRWQTLLAGPLKLARYSIQRKDIFGSMIFGLGWAIAGTCPIPALAMFASGNVLGIVVIAGLFAGIMLRDLVVRKGASEHERLLDGIDVGPAAVR